MDDGEVEEVVDGGVVLVVGLGGGFLVVVDEEVEGLGFGEFEVEGVEDEVEFFVGEVGVFVGVEEVELWGVSIGGDGWGEGESMVLLMCVFCLLESLL